MSQASCVKIFLLAINLFMNLIISKNMRFLEDVCGKISSIRLFNLTIFVLAFM